MYLASLITSSFLWLSLHPGQAPGKVHSTVSTGRSLEHLEHFMLCFCWSNLCSVHTKCDCKYGEDIVLRLVQAECALTAEVPGCPQLLLPGHRVIQVVDIGDGRHARNVPGRDVLGSDHCQLPALEHHCTVGSTGVVQQAGQQVHTGTKVFRGGSSDKLRFNFSFNFCFSILPV